MSQRSLRVEISLCRKESKAVRRNLLTHCILGTLVASVLAHASLTTPFASKASLADDVLSLDGLAEVRISVDDLPPLIAELNVTSEIVERQLKERLGESPIQVIVDKKAPLLKIRIEATHDSFAPNALAFCMTLSLVQSAHVDRVDRTLSVPTYHHTRVGLFPEEQTAEMVRICVNLVVDKFLGKVELATERGEE